MIGPDPGRLDDDAVHVLVFGPGFGESIGVRLPSGRWIVVDSLRYARDPRNVVPMLEVCRRPGESLACLILTHPHDDHSGGMDELVDHHVEGPVGCVPGLLDPATAWLDSQNAAEIVAKGRSEHALAAITTKWHADPLSIWELETGSWREIGDARLEALNPSRSAVRAFAASGSDKFNEISTPLLLSWHEARLILGADLPATLWSDQTGAGTRPLRLHSLLKVPHHASKNAIPSLLLDGDAERAWVIAPFASKGLPNFAKDHGIEMLEPHVTRIHLTALAHAVKGRVASRRSGTREEVERSRERKKFGSLVINLEADPIPQSDAWIHVRIGADGSVNSIVRGPAGFEVLTRG